MEKTEENEAKLNEEKKSGGHAREGMRQREDKKKVKNNEGIENEKRKGVRLHLDETCLPFQG